ncbi:hypothetical protein ONZ45_g15191 [Pleurotus djamor]|nr:hypothetical protein ONZ45_g15191 [Pleurotus djamor]
MIAIRYNTRTAKYHHQVWYRPRSLMSSVPKARSLSFDTSVMVLSLTAPPGNRRVAIVLPTCFHSYASPFQESRGCRLSFHPRVPPRTRDRGLLFTSPSRQMIGSSSYYGFYDLSHQGCAVVQTCFCRLSKRGTSLSTTMTVAAAHMSMLSRVASVPWCSVLDTASCLVYGSFIFGVNGDHYWLPQTTFDDKFLMPSIGFGRRFLFFFRCLLFTIINCEDGSLEVVFCIASHLFSALERATNHLLYRPSPLHLCPEPSLLYLKMSSCRLPTPKRVTNNHDPLISAHIPMLEPTSSIGSPTLIPPFEDSLSCRHRRSVLARAVNHLVAAVVTGTHHAPTSYPNHN